MTSKCNIFLLISSLSRLICFLLTVIFYNELQINEIHLYYNACYLLYRHGIERVNWIFGKWMLPRLFNDTYRNCICDITTTSRFSVNFINLPAGLIWVLKTFRFIDGCNWQCNCRALTRERQTSSFFVLVLGCFTVERILRQSEICNPKVVKRTSRCLNGIWMSLAEVTGRKEGTLSLLQRCRRASPYGVYESLSLLEHENAPASSRRSCPLVVWDRRTLVCELTRTRCHVISMSIMLFRR